MVCARAASIAFACNPPPLPPNARLLAFRFSKSHCFISVFWVSLRSLHRSLSLSLVLCVSRFSRLLPLIVFLSLVLNPNARILSLACLLACFACRDFVSLVCFAATRTRTQRTTGGAVRAPGKGGQDASGLRSLPARGVETASLPPGDFDHSARRTVRSTYSGAGWLESVAATSTYRTSCHIFCFSSVSRYRGVSFGVWQPYHMYCRPSRFSLNGLVHFSGIVPPKRLRLVHYCVLCAMSPLGLVAPWRSALTRVTQCMYALEPRSKHLHTSAPPLYSCRCRYFVFPCRWLRTSRRKFRTSAAPWPPSDRLKSFQGRRFSGHTLGIFHPCLSRYHTHEVHIAVLHFRVLAPLHAAGVAPIPPWFLLAWACVGRRAAVGQCTLPVAVFGQSFLLRTTAVSDWMGPMVFLLFAK